MAAQSSSSLASENETKEHPYQISEVPGPRGAYEARQIKDVGFYVRVDMPGVPQDGVKLVKYGDTQTVTFSGKAPEYWIGCDSSTRTYGGYVVLDRDPNRVEVEMTVKNGSMRLFFPGVDGTLHFLGSLKRPPNAQDRGEDDSVVYNQHDGRHALKSSVSPTIAFSHINPFLIQGVEGVHENKVGTDEVGEECMYVRLDMPGLAPNLFRIAVNTENNHQDTLVYGGEGNKEHPFDQGGRAYYVSFTFYCGCCQIDDVQFNLTDGVVRIFLRKCKNKDSKGLPNIRNAGSNPRKRR